MARLETRLGSYPKLHSSQNSDLNLSSSNLTIKVFKSFINSPLARFKNTLLNSPLLKLCYNFLNNKSTITENSIKFTKLLNSLIVPITVKLSNHLPYHSFFKTLFSMILPWKMSQQTRKPTIYPVQLSHRKWNRELNDSRKPNNKSPSIYIWLSFETINVHNRRVEAQAETQIELIYFIISLPPFSIFWPPFHFVEL